MRKTIGAVAVAVILVACAQRAPEVSQQGAPATDAAAVRQAIESANAGLIAALEKSDSVGAASFYAPDAMVMPEGMPAATGRGEIQKTFGGMIAAVKFSGMKLDIQN